MSLSTTDFPEPLAPSRIRMLPFGTRKLTARRTTCSSKANETLSKTTADEAAVSSDTSVPMGSGPCSMPLAMCRHGPFSVHDRRKVLHLVIHFGDEAILALLRVALGRLVVWR